MSNLVEFLRSHGTEGVKMLEAQFAIHAARHKTKPSLILFKYDQLNSPMSHPIVQECRGIVLDESRDWHIVVFPYQKFFNMREVANAAVIDWTKPVRAYEKIDGSLLTMYFSQGEWHVATSGVPDASGKLHDGHKPSTEGDEGDDGEEGESAAAAPSVVEEPQERSKVPDPETGLTPIGTGPNRKSFSELFWEVFHLLGYRLPDAPEDCNKCYMFELATPQNIVIIRHQRAHLYLHGVRDLTTLQEELPDTYCEKFGWTLTPMRVITEGKNQFEKEVLSSVNTLNGLESEGFVICDARFNRFKLKCQSYVNLSLLHNPDGNQWKRLVGIIQVNEGSEFLAYFPQHTELYNTLYDRYNVVLDALRRANTKFENTDSKTLASLAKKLPQWISGPLFIVRRTKEDFKTFYSAPQRYGMLCELLDPNKPAPQMPNLDAIQLPTSEATSSTKTEGTSEQN